MIFEFVGKIKNINSEGYEEESAALHLSEIHGKFPKPLEEVKILKDSKANDVLVKAQASVSSYYGYYDKDLNVAIDTFKAYLEELEKRFGGEISRDEGFFNNSKTFHKLIW